MEDRDAALADQVCAELLEALDRMAPAERLAFVLHTLFALPPGEIEEITRSP